MYKRNAGCVLNMNTLTINKNCSMLKVISIKIPHYAYTNRQAQRRKTNDSGNLLQKDKKEKLNNGQPANKTTHLQTAPADTKPKFAKELFSCQRTRR